MTPGGGGLSGYAPGLPAHSPSLSSSPRPSPPYAGVPRTSQFPDLTASSTNSRFRASPFLNSGSCANTTCLADPLLAGTCHNIRAGIVVLTGNLNVAYTLHLRLRFDFSRGADAFKPH